MSDEQGAAKKKSTEGPWVHLCEHLSCKKWGGFGFAIGRGPANWFCIEHRPTVWPPSKQA